MKYVRPLFLCTLAMVALSLGCTGSSEYVEVTGKVTLDGAPVTDALISFTPRDREDGGQNAIGRTDSSGTYSMNTSTNKGVKPGNYQVKITTIPPEGESADPEAAASSSSDAYANAARGPSSTSKFVDPIPAQYNSQTTLTLQVDGKMTKDFAMTKSGS